MFLHIGRDMIVRYDDIIGIFDIETASISKITREYLSASPKKKIVSVTDELPKSFIVCSGLNAKNNDKNTTKVYISQISSATLKKRLESAKSPGDLLHEKGLAEE
jgi:extracellular matrix regulatory protein B